MLNNNHGSAVAIVMMFIAVISILGVGLLAQSRMDLQITSSIRSYEKMFHLGDGGATIAFNNISNKNTMVTYEGEEKVEYLVQDKEEKEAGKYDALVKLCGIDNDPQNIPGWEVGSYFRELWMAEGKGKRETDLFGAGTGTPTSVVVVAASKLKRTD